MARNWAIEASDILIHRDAELRAKTEKLKARVQGITDIEELRSSALESCDKWFEGYRDIGYRYQQMSEAMLWASLFTSTVAAVLAYSLYGLRDKNRVV